MSSETEQSKLPENLIPEAKDFVQETFKRIEQDTQGEFSGTSYGHAAGNMALSLATEAELDRSPEQQKKHLRELAQRQIDKFGPAIIPFLRDELRLVIEETDTSSDS